MSSWQSDTIQTNGIRLHVTRTGGAKPPLVLAHGYSDDGLCWTPVAEELAMAYDVVMPDARGHGLSDAPDGDYGPIEQAADLAGVIEGLGLQRPIIVGHSMGAMTTLTLAGRYPALPGAIALEDPPPWWADDCVPPFGEEWQRQTRAWIVGLQQQTVPEIIAAQRAHQPNWPSAEFKPWAAAKLRVHLNSLNRLAPLNINWPALLASVQCPVLLMTAEPALGALVSARQAAALQDSVPQTRIIHFAEAGHSIRRDQFQGYMNVIHRFCATVTASTDLRMVWPMHNEA